jgi:thiol-disulfide isomerase/thioredoxin
VITRLCFRCAVAFLVLLTFADSASAQQRVSGLWDAHVTIGGLDIPFQIEISGDGSTVSGAFLNGEDKATSSSGRFEGNSLVLNFDQYAETLQATLKDGELTGTIEGWFGPGGRKNLPFSAKPFVRIAESASQTIPSIGGLWEIENKSPKGELAWRFIVRQSGADVSAAILRVDGDTGVLTGHYKDGKFVLSHFSGERPYLLEVAPQSDGSILLSLKGYSGAKELTAYRPADARAKGLPEPTDPAQHTNVKDSSKPFEFKFRDLDGETIANTDPRFRGKVVLVNVTGSWCPNCHDEAPFLAELYHRYHDAGLEIVALDFEESEQLENLTRLRAFIKHYGVDYTVLVGGSPDEVNEKIPQLVNLNAWPTTVFVGRDGLVKSIHVGFASTASGEFNKLLKEEIAARVQALLAENQHASR